MRLLVLRAVPRVDVLPLLFFVDPADFLLLTFLLPLDFFAAELEPFLLPLDFFADERELFLLLFALLLLVFRGAIKTIRARAHCRFCHKPNESVIGPTARAVRSSYCRNLIVIG